MSLHNAKEMVVRCLRGLDLFVFYVTNILHLILTAARGDITRLVQEEYARAKDGSDPTAHFYGLPFEDELRKWYDREASGIKEANQASGNYASTLAKLSQEFSALVSYLIHV